jgi:hypothetical protein
MNDGGKSQVKKLLSKQTLEKGNAKFSVLKWRD